MFSQFLVVLVYSLQNTKRTAAVAEEGFTVTHALSNLHIQHMCREQMKLVARRMGHLGKQVDGLIEVHLLICHVGLVNLCLVPSVTVP